MFFSSDRLCLAACAALVSISWIAPEGAPNEPANPQIDFAGFLEDAEAVGKLRESRRVSEAEFRRMAGEPGTVVLDTRSAERFRQFHLAGAVHLNLADFTKEALAEVIPSQDTRVLIYCNNNFTRAPRDSMLSKLPPAALNIPTFIGLYTYGYRNIWELGPAIDPAAGALAFDGELASIVAGNS